MLAGHMVKWNVKMFANTAASVTNASATYWFESSSNPQITCTPKTKME